MLVFILHNRAQVTQIHLSDILDVEFSNSCSFSFCVPTALIYPRSLNMIFHLYIDVLCAVIIKVFLGI